MGGFLGRILGFDRRSDYFSGRRELQRGNDSKLPGARYSKSIRVPKNYRVSRGIYYFYERINFRINDISEESTKYGEDNLRNLAIRYLKFFF